MAEPCTAQGVFRNLAFLLFFSTSQALNNGVGRTPAMGWNSWNFFRCDINETLIRQVADAMVDSGLAAAGYKYVNVDDCWQEKRDASGEVVPFANKFPSGMKALADYVHSKGLLFGVYSDTGNKTCEGYPGSWGHEEQDALTYAKWGVDYLKHDYCGMEKTQVSVQASYETMRDALNATGRPILFSLCSWGTGAPWLWGSEVGNSWRTGIDVFAAWDAPQAKEMQLPSFLQPILTAVQAVEDLADHAGPGGFNDPDMLVVGLEGMYPYGIVKECPKHIKGCKPGEYISRDRWGKVGGLSQTEQRTHFAYWCMLASPLILGNDPRDMSKATLSILTAKDILAINQDPLGKQGRKVWQHDTTSLWVKPLSLGHFAAMLFNGGNTALDMTLNFSRDIPEAAKAWAREGIAGADPVCEDLEKECKQWATAGECEINPGFMFVKCKASCPEACSHPFGPPGPKATAFIRDAWLEEDLGPFLASYTAKLVEPHEGRVLLVTFTEPEAAALWTKKETAPTGLSIEKGQSTMGGAGEGTGAMIRRDLREHESHAEKALRAKVERLTKSLDAAAQQVKMLKAAGDSLDAGGISVQADCTDGREGTTRMLLAANAFTVAVLLFVWLRKARGQPKPRLHTN